MMMLIGQKLGILPIESELTKLAKKNGWME